jgi:trans-aconitate methyltransferase
MEHNLMRPMKEASTSSLHDEKQAVAFYEDRYEQGYMDEWPPEKKLKIFEVIRELPLPEKGSALDFGCGNGVLTDIIRQALPSWTVFGTDISTIAISNARTRYPNCRFFEANNPQFAQYKFDFIFSNHVIEHVFDLPAVFHQMAGYLQPRSSMLHFLPCGNTGSFEHQICLLRSDGINRKLGNRFFFEDEGHLRRLTTEEFARLCATQRFKLVKEFYSNQYHGAIDWITNSSPKFVWMFSGTSRAVDAAANHKLQEIRRNLLFLSALRLPAQIVAKLLRKRNKRLKDYLVLLAGLPLFPLSRPLDRYLKSRAREEWNDRKHERNGSEMCLFFTRD